MAGVNSVDLRDQTGTPYGVRRIDTDSGTIKDNTPVVGLSDELGNTASPTTPVAVSTLFGVPSTFDSLMTVAKTVNIQKGQLNKPYLHARIPNEGVESSRVVQAVVDATTIVSQVIRLSKDNITGLALTLESAGGVLLDNFEGYANSAELQAEWVESGAVATLETTIVAGGTKSMKLPLTTNGDSWEDTITSTDYTGFTGSFNFYQNNAAGVLKVYIQDNVGNKKYSEIPVITVNEWQTTEVAEVAMTEDPGNGLDTDVTQIVVIGFEVVTKKLGASAYIDNLVATPPPGQVEVKLWDMGTTAPISGTTSIDSGTQYEKLGGSNSSVILDLLGGKRLYHLHDVFTAGAFKNEPTNETLNVNNYYILELKYVDTDVSVYGPDPSFNTNYYSSGYAATSPDEATAITAVGPYSDIMFFIQSMQDIYITSSAWKFNATPNGESDIFVYAEDTGMNLAGVVIDHEESPGQSEVYGFSDRPIYLEDGGKLESYYNDDYTDSVTKITITMTYLYEEPTVNG